MDYFHVDTRSLPPIQTRLRYSVLTRIFMQFLPDMNFNNTRMKHGFKKKTDVLLLDP